MFPNVGGVGQDGPVTAKEPVLAGGLYQAEVREVGRETM